MTNPPKYKIPTVWEFLYVRGKWRYKVAYGGRGGAKSWNFALALLLLAMGQPMRILCAREIQRSISDSVIRLLTDIITRNNWSDSFVVQRNSITYDHGNGAQSIFLFEGLYRNITRLKSLEGIDIVWIEEAESVSQDSLDILIPTIRKKGSEIWISFNPDQIDDPVWDMFVVKERDDSKVVKTTWEDNFHFPEVLKKELEWMRAHDYDKYRWVWEGEPRQISDALVFKGKFVVESFNTPTDATFYHGADWGFSVDPTVVVRMFIDGKELKIDMEAWAIGTPIDQLPLLFSKIETTAKWQIIADSARPETIDHMRRHGFPKITRSRKGAKSIEDGIEFMRGFDRIVIHPRCQHVIDEFKTYSYKIDHRTGLPIPRVEDANNHCIDAIRYALEPVRKPMTTVAIEGRLL